MRANRVARPHPSRRAYAPASLGNVSASALLRMRTNIACCKVHHTNSPSPSRGAFAAAHAGWSDPCIFLFFCRFGIFHPRSHDLKQHALPRSRDAFAPEFLHLCFAHPESRGGRSAEKRSGAALSTRWARSEERRV